MAITDSISDPRAALSRGLTRLSEPKIERRAILIVLGIAAVARIAIAVLFPVQEFYIEDSDSYIRSARDILAGRLIRSDLIMPGYPALLALTGAHPAMRLCVDILISLAGVWCLVRLTQAVSGDRIAGLLAGLIWALYPFAIFYTLAGLTETLFVTLLLAGFLAYYRKAYTLGSLAMVAAIMTRPLVELLAPILVLTFALVVHREPLRRAFKHAAVLVAIYLCLMTPWWIHNVAKYGSFVRLNLASGVVLYAGNNPMNRSGGVEAGVDFDLGGFKHISDPVAWDRAIRDAAVQFIVEHPRRFVELAGLKLQRLWGPGAGARHVAVSLVSFLPIVGLAIIGFIVQLRRRPRSLVPIILFMGYTTAVHMVTIATLRYRFPMEPFLVLFAGTALACGLRIVLNGTIRPSAHAPA
jgi:hypothetical protein